MQKSLSFNKGITTSPSDLLSDDTELSASRDLIFRNGEIQPLRQAAAFGQTDHKLLYIHKGADYTNAITYDGTNLYWGALDTENGSISKNEDKFSVGTVSDISSVGNTLVVATDEGIYYILYKGGKYIGLGNNIPLAEIDFDFKNITFDMKFEQSSRTPCNYGNCVSQLSDEKAYYGAKHEFMSAGGSAPSGYKTTSVYHRYEIIDSSKESDFQDTIQGHVAQAINWVKEKGVFAFPFFLRYAYKLYDGSYTRISPPIICYPSVNRNFHMCHYVWDSTNKVFSYSTSGSTYGTSEFYFIEFAELKYKFGLGAQNKLKNWSDIIKGITVFATEPVLPFHIDRGWKIVEANDTNKRPLFNKAFLTYKEKLFNYNDDTSTQNWNGKDGGRYIAKQQVQPTYRDDNDIIDELLTRTQFYKLFTIPLTEFDDEWHTTASGSSGDKIRINQGLLLNLAQQEQLLNDDYYGWCKLSAAKCITYNNRINLIGVKRFPVKRIDFSFSMAVNYGETSTQYVHIVSDKMDTWIGTNFIVSSDTDSGSWFYYPDPNATEFVTKENGGLFKRIPLQQHPRLHGAYAFSELPCGKKTVFNEQVDTTSYTSPYEVLDSQIFTSVVNNPFVFQASGDNTVGTGSILGIAANTEPISQGQFGQYPLIVFTTEGIYGLSVNSEGLYSASYPISREVCNNPESITPTGNVVYFTSDKGLMAVSGGSVRCVSPQLSGANPPYSDATDSFLTFVRNAFLAYDYRDSLLFIYNVSYDYAYVYNLLDGTFATISLGSKRIQRAVSNYPDTLLQDADNNVYSFSKIPVAQADTQTYSGTFTTRPLKLGSSIQLKTIHQIVHLFNSADGTLKLRVYASNDCRNWVELHSLHGKPWKYYRFSYTLSNISASDTFAGTVIDFAPRFTNKIR